MGTEWDDPEDNEPEGLRSHAKKLEKQNKELADRLAKAEAFARSVTVKEVLTAKNVNPKIAKFIPTELSDESEISSWLEENADVFGVKVGQPEPQAPAEEPAQPDPGNFLALAAMAAAETGGAPVHPADDAMKNIQSTETKADLMKILSGIGIPLD